MNSTCVLILLLAASVLSVKHESLSSHNGSLKFYNRFEKNHSEPINTKIPLQMHYTNERNLRKESFKLGQQISTIKRNTGFKKRDLKHKILNLKNQSHVLSSNVHAEDKIAKQKERSIKEDLNHAEKFKELYEQREQVNRERLSKALPDQVASLKKLTDFDHERREHWAHKEDKEQKNLQSTVEGDIKANVANMNKEANVQGQIMALKADLSNVDATAEFAEGKLEAKKHHIDNVVAKDTALDQHRRENEEKEATAAASEMSPHDEYHQNLLHGDDHVHDNLHKSHELEM